LREPQADKKSIKKAIPSPQTVVTLLTSVKAIKPCSIFNFIVALSKQEGNTHMNWEAIGVVVEIVGTIAVILTLVYLSKQIQGGNKQAELEGLRHTIDGFNQYCDLIVSSIETANLMNRGRRGLAELNEDELLQFEHIHYRFLNTMESWARSIQLTARDKDYREKQESNMKETVFVWFGNPGSRAIWESFRNSFPLLQETVDKALMEFDQQP
jgi:hypothetical protein